MVGGHFVFVGLIGCVVDSFICGCGFAVYVNSAPEDRRKGRPKHVERTFSF